MLLLVLNPLAPLSSSVSILSSTVAELVKPQPLSARDLDSILILAAVCVGCARSACD